MSRFIFFALLFTAGSVWAGVSEQTSTTDDVFTVFLPNDKDETVYNLVLSECIARLDNISFKYKQMDGKHSALTDISDNKNSLTFYINGENYHNGAAYASKIKEIVYDYHPTSEQSIYIYHPGITNKRLINRMKTIDSNKFHDKTLLKTLSIYFDSDIAEKETKIKNLCETLFKVNTED